MHPGRNSGMTSICRTYGTRYQLVITPCGPSIQRPRRDHCYGNYRTTIHRQHLPNNLKSHLNRRLHNQLNLSKPRHPRFYPPHKSVLSAGSKNLLNHYITEVKHSMRYGHHANNLIIYRHFNIDILNLTLDRPKHLLFDDPDLIKTHIHAAHAFTKKICKATIRSCIRKAHIHNRTACLYFKRLRDESHDPQQLSCAVLIAEHILFKYNDYLDLKTLRKYQKLKRR
eukprot:481324_1